MKGKNKTHYFRGEKWKHVEKIKKLKNDFEKRTELLNTIVNSVDGLIKNTDNAVSEIREMVETANKTIEGIDGFVTKLSTDYDTMRKEIDAMKNNYWLKLFGVFRKEIGFRS